MEKEIASFSKNRTELVKVRLQDFKDKQYNENMEDWKTSPGVIDETVRVAKTFLEEHPEERKKILAHGKESIVGSPIISTFLGWNQSRHSGLDEANSRKPGWDGDLQRDHPAR